MVTDFWNSQDCADYLRVSREHFLKRIATVRGFPRPGSFPVMVRGRLTATGPRWKAAEVKVWAENAWTTA